WLYFVILPARQNAGELIRFVYFGGKILQVALPLLGVILFERRWPRPVRPHPRGLTTGLVFGLSSAVAIMLLYFFGLRGSPSLAEMPEKIGAKLDEFHIKSLAAYIMM